MRYLATFLFLFLTTSAAQPKEFSRSSAKSSQPVLSQPLVWVSAAAAAATSLPEAFIADPSSWVFAPYTAGTVLPTASGRDVWLKFTLAAASRPQSWVIVVPRWTIQEVVLYDEFDKAARPLEKAGASIAHTQWIRDSRTPSFEVATGSIEKTFYLRFVHYAPIPERPRLVSQIEFADATGYVGNLLGLTLAGFGLLILASLVALVSSRNTVFLSLMVFMVAILLNFLVQLGFASSFLWPNSVHLSNAMFWAAPLFMIAVGNWFFAHATHAKDTNQRVYYWLCSVALASFLLGLYKLVNIDPAQNTLFNGWALFVIASTLASLAWLSWRGMRSNIWLLVALIPMLFVSFSRLAYNNGWAGQLEQTQHISAFFVQLSLAWLFVVLLWRNRVSLLSSDLAAALNQFDPTSGLIKAQIAQRRLPLLLARADRLEVCCGVLMLRWLNYPGLKSRVGAQKYNAMQRSFGALLNHLMRDVDTAAHFGDGHFVLLIEGPISRVALSQLATKIMTVCMRESNAASPQVRFDFHIAIWQASLTPATAQEVTQRLQTRLDRISAGTERPVQFVDSLSSDMDHTSEDQQTQRRNSVLAKINAIEALPSFTAAFTAAEPKGS